MTYKDHNIARLNNLHTAQTNRWIAQQGIQVKSFIATPIDLLKAQQLATTLLKRHAKLLTKEQLHLLNNFLRSAANGKMRSTITLSQCHKVLNVSTKINRKLFKAHRLLH